MAPTEAAGTESKKRERGLDLRDLNRLFDTEPDDYRVAWNELKNRVNERNSNARQTIPSVIFTRCSYHWHDRTNVNQ